MGIDGDDAPGAPLLELRRVAIAYGRPGKGVEVCSDISLSVNPGECVAVVGESGSGKSVSARSVLGLLGVDGSVTRGEIVVAGRSVGGFSQRQFRRSRLRGRDVGMIFQSPGLALNPVCTIGVQMRESLRVGSVARAQMRDRGIEWLRRVGLPDPADCWDRYPHELSGGQQQRAMIAIALASGPRLLVADEPTTALDVTVQAQVLRLMRTMQLELDLGLLLITHDFGVVSAIADRVVVVYSGEVVETGTVDEVIHDPQHPYTKALLGCLPTGVPGARIDALPGSVPSPDRIPSGCRFNPRCSVALPTCAVELAPTTTIAAGRMVRCVHAREMATP